MRRQWRKRRREHDWRFANECFGRIESGGGIESGGRIESHCGIEPDACERPEHDRKACDRARGQRVLWHERS